jgi:hypothetical protein
MTFSIAVALFLSALAAATGMAVYRRGRDRMYATLAARSLDSARAMRFGPGLSHAHAQTLAPAFAAGRLVRVAEFLDTPTLARLRDEALSTLARTEHSFIPLHKKGGTLSYEQILRSAPCLAAFYHSPSLQSWISIVTRTPVVQTPVRDQSSLSVLCYRDAGDHIGWHYDHNFYRGRHFTVLLALVNRAADTGLSQCHLERQLEDGTVREIDTSENTLVLFEGSCVRHRATPTAAGDLRIMLSMTYSDDPRISPVKELARRLKDTAYYGIRALWD